MSIDLKICWKTVAKNSRILIIIQCQKEKKGEGKPKKKKNDRNNNRRKGSKRRNVLGRIFSLIRNTRRGRRWGWRSEIGRESVMYYCAQGQSRRWHIGDWFLAYRVLRGFSRGSHVGYPIPPPSPPPPPPIKIRSVINGMSRDIFRPSFMYEAPITIGRRIIETSASIDRQPRYRQLLSALRGVARMHACVRALEKMRRHPSLSLQNFVQTFHMENLSTPFSAHILEIWFFLSFFFRCPRWIRFLRRSKFYAWYFIFLESENIYIFFSNISWRVEKKNKNLEIIRVVYKSWR